MVKHPECNAGDVGLTPGLGTRIQPTTTAACVCAPDVASAVSDSVTPGTGAHQAPLSMEFSKQEYLSGLTFPTSGDLPNPRIKPVSCTSCPAGRLFTPGPPRKL